MYLSIRDDIVFAAGYASLAEGLRDLNVEGVELFVHRDDTVPAIQPAGDRKRLSLCSPGGLTELQEQAATAGVTIAALCMGNNFNAEDKPAEIAWAVRTIQAAAALGAPAIRVDAIMSGEKHLPLEERRRLVAQSIRSILDETAEIDVDLGIENHGFQGNDPEFLTGLLLDVDSPRLGLTLDSGNFYWRGWPLSRVYEIFEQFAPVVKHTHIKNIAYPPELREIQREIGYEYGKYVCPIHEGDIDHTRYFAALQRAGYDRDLCLEDESLGKYAPEQRQANLRAAADFFRVQIGAQ
ncbi:MAG TPA: sugar phosphate isomerase/epimerase family protein [Chthonomonadaceae bacterium]|nr:sugar phosphate isomerase/epimerase family protein [Chthonomonadaceae bacterium]